MKLGLALSGGGAKGAAHIGVLQALKEENIDIEYISGCSSGSIIATLYSCGYEPYDILAIFNNYCKYITDYDKTLPFKFIKCIFTGKIEIKGLAKGNNLEYLLKKYCNDKGIKDIKDIERKIAIPTVDISTGEIIYYTNHEFDIENQSIEEKNNIFDDYPTYINSGNIASIVRASCSFPGVFVPKLMSGRNLVDGGVRVNTPVEVLKTMGADKTLAIGFNSKKRNVNQINNVIDVTIQSFDIQSHQANIEQIKKADLVLMPKLPEIGLIECNRGTYIANQGYKLIKDNIQEIRKMLE